MRVTSKGPVVSVGEGRPSTLYHYTNAAGLLGIVKEQALWATHIQFLNDGEELIYAARQISEYARSRAEGDASYRGQRLRAIADGVEDHADGRYGEVFVSCFCSEPDLLSQWRSYGRDGG